MNKSVILSIGMILAVGIAFFAYFQYFNASTKETPNEIEYPLGADLTLNDLKKMQQEIDRKNYRKEFPAFDSTVPKVRQVGIYSGKVIEEKYHCGDLCPDHGIYFLSYKDVDLAYTSEETDQCAAVEGHKIYATDHGFRYVGCSPLENKYSN